MALPFPCPVTSIAWEGAGVEERKGGGGEKGEIWDGRGEGKKTTSTRNENDFMR